VYQDDVDYVQNDAQLKSERFPLAEVLIMAAMNKAEAAQKSSATPSGSDKSRYEVV
jgi:hypothetical protein